MIFRILEDQFAQKSRESKAADQRFMQLALTLGRRGLGRSWPNPAVGAVLVNDGIVIGRGWTQASGRPHAETEAIARAGVAARNATLYVTLEPCSHFGKTPPCADAIVAAGITRVVSAIEDPNPEVAGRGHAPLRVVLDRSLRISGTSQLVRSARETPLWIMASTVAEAPAAAKLGAAGAQVIRVPITSATQRLDIAAVLTALSDKGITRLLVEG